MISRIRLQYGSNTVRVVARGGQPWFVHDDICRVLGIADAIRAAGRLDDYERTAAVLHTLSGSEAVVIVSLCGLYSLIARAPRRAEVRAFKRWFTIGALPSIQAACGEAVPPPSGAEEGLHSTTEIARSLGVAPGALGRRARHLRVHA